MDKDQLKAVVTKQNLDYYESIRERHLRTTDIPVSGVDREWQALRVAVETNKISLDELREHIGCPPSNESRHWDRWEDWQEDWRKGRPIPAKKVIDARALPASTASPTSTKTMTAPRYGKNRSKIAPAKTDAQLESLRQELRKSSNGSNLGQRR